MHLVPPTDPILWTCAAPVTDIAAQVLPHLEEMRTLMREHKGVALAAPQVGLSLRFFVTEGGLFVNPVIVEKRHGYLALNEGCLSFPGVTRNVWRYRSVRLSFTDKDGAKQRLDLSGVDAQIVAHEVSHLAGVCLVERPCV